MAPNKRKPFGEKAENGHEKEGQSPVTATIPSNETTAVSLSNLYKMIVILICLVISYHYYHCHCGHGSKMDVLASVDETISVRREFIIPCSDDYKTELEKFTGCAPKKCGRFVKDDIITEEEAKKLLKVVKTGMSFGGSSGGASILDLHTGALSKGDKFINIYHLIQSRTDPIFEEEDFILYRNLKNRIKKEIADTFDIPVAKLHLTKPTFFSRMTTKPAKTLHDEYWHPHVDKETYGSFHYTSLMYLANYGTDFTGGRFIFIDKDVNKTLEPKVGRLSFFTSGSENSHHVEKLESGIRYAITVSFTCDPDQMIADPRLPPSKPKKAKSAAKKS